ncbi:hypothetical protein FIBSPDRAFT_757998 [Athelia psychrophila]|uniref:HMG domain-containing protein n=1 Tax=Athelia psychrophila TaxID=1759441 RepID=A0A165ZH84_9AGAM|nr:hypothetical protein FIBSPDRAFT_757998 [Fibularhizoctonia sp. CBS 109695]
MPARNRKRPRLTEPGDDVPSTSQVPPVTVSNLAEEDFWTGAAGNESFPPANLEGDTYDQYCELVVNDGVSFYQITTTIYVVQGWDVRSNAGTDSWFHLQRKKIGDDWVAVCFCPTQECVHVRFARELDNTGEPEEGTFHKDTDDEAVILFSRQSAAAPDSFLNQFSVIFASQTSVKSRAVVAYNGPNDGLGIWSCTKDQGTGCGHITMARHELQKLLLQDPDARDLLHPEHEDDDLLASVSYLPILAPLWASLSSDNSLYPRSSPSRQFPNCILFTNYGSCFFHPPTTRSTTRQAERRPCIIYTLVGTHEAEIELQQCLLCPPNRRRFVGPETRELGLFNYNNRILCTHDLLDEYTSAFTSSETPFVAWVATISRRYSNYNSEKSFLTEKMFRSVWFSYARLQDLDSEMLCPVCGPIPEDTIWDGITLAFSQKHLLPSLCPPTISNEHSLQRDNVRYSSHMQYIPDQKLRKSVRKVISGRSLVLHADEEVDADDHSESEWTERAAQELLDRVDAIPNVADELGRLHESLKDVFNANFGIEALGAEYKAPAAYCRLFIQLSAEESALQMSNRPALKALSMFVTDPTATNASRLVGIPTLYETLRHHEINQELYPENLLRLCQWMLERGEALLRSIIKYEAPVIDESASSADADWSKTGCSYSLPQIRHRPRYPNLKHDLRKEPGGRRGVKCSKFYSKYGEQRLTGGIMCGWCTHSVCYGFHCIPRGEGRNDVFSAILTRWPQAPKTVVYDFACALGPYCMTREPDFFADTLFVIDAFHAKGHTRCAPAAFLTSYANTDPRLARINSSAAECGNGGLSRIRKSVSYMSQDRAIIYTKVFISIWNRLVIRKMLCLQ